MLTKLLILYKEKSKNDIIGYVRVESSISSLSSIANLFGFNREFSYKNKKVTLEDEWYLYGTLDTLIKNTHSQDYEKFSKQYSDKLVKEDEGNFLKSGDYFVYEIPLSDFNLGDNRKETLKNIEKSLMNNKLIDFFSGSIKGVETVTFKKRKNLYLSFNPNIIDNFYNDGKDELILHRFFMGAISKLN